MCFIAKKSVKRRIADRDIHVQKILWRDSFGLIRSPFYPNCIWEIGETKKAQIEPIMYEKFDLLEIKEGLHSAASIVKYSNKFSTWFGTNMGPVTWVCDADEWMIVFDCIIPKGSIYYMNSENECVSDCLKLVKEVDAIEWP